MVKMVHFMNSNLVFKSCLFPIHSAISSPCGLQSARRRLEWTQKLQWTHKSCWGSWVHLQMIHYRKAQGPMCPQQWAGPQRIRRSSCLHDWLFSFMVLQMCSPPLVDTHPLFFPAFLSSRIKLRSGPWMQCKVIKILISQPGYLGLSPCFKHLFWVWARSWWWFPWSWLCSQPHRPQ